MNVTNKMNITDDFIKEFESTTKLKLHKEDENKYYECSGKSHQSIVIKLQRYNAGRNIKAFATNDIVKDVTIISFRPSIL